ncbi:MAG: Na/Pi symporter, partial [Clostridia bacterium]|nr:Na/Pi symporter [Clostridia bacterium]
MFGFFLFLTGIFVFKESLKVIPHRFVENILANAASSPLKGAVTSTFLTALVQSSSLVMILTIGFVDAGILGFPQTIGIILGANIGTCITSQIISLDLTDFALKAMILGIVLLPVS